MIQSKCFINPFLQTAKKTDIDLEKRVIFVSITLFNHRRNMVGLLMLGLSQRLIRATPLGLMY